MRLTLTLLALLMALAVHAQHTNILISDQNLPNEPAILIDPKNPANIMAGANLDNVYYSTDTGHTWTISQLHSDTIGVWGDPCLIVDTAQNFYYMHLSNPTTGSWIDRIVVQKQTTFGGTWTDGTYTGLNGTKAQDKEWAVVDPQNNHIYVTWTQFDQYGTNDPADSSIILFSRSEDAGQTWTSPHRLSQYAGDCIDSDNTTEGAVPAVGPNGEIYVAWSWRDSIWFDRSLDGGDTWLDGDLRVASQPGGWDYSISGLQRCNGLPITLCDLSNGPHRGTIYVNWTDQRNGAGDTDVWLSKSTDGGNIWSAPLRINDDAAGKQQFLTWMAVDQSTGYLYTVYYDRRNYSDDQTDVFMAVSKDGGATFTNFIISESPFTPTSNVFFGDYNNISAVNGIIRPIWTRLNNQQLSLWTALIDTATNDTTPTAVTPTERYPFVLDQNYPNPFSGATRFSFKLHSAAVITLRVIDVYGREVARPINNELTGSGKYIRDFDARSAGLAPGIYYLILDLGSQHKSRRFIYH